MIVVNRSVARRLFSAYNGWTQIKQAFPGRKLMDSNKVGVSRPINENERGGCFPSSFLLKAISIEKISLEKSDCFDRIPKPWYNDTESKYSLMKSALPL